MRARAVVVAGVASAAMLAAPAASFAYGPGGGDGPTPPGFGTTETACSAGPAGCHLHAASARCKLTVDVPKGTFDEKTNVVISRISKASADSHLNTAKKHTVCAFGVGLFRNGHRVHVAKHHPSLDLTFTGLPIKATDHLRILIPNDGSKPKPATFSDQLATAQLRFTHELAIVRANS